MQHMGDKSVSSGIRCEGEVMHAFSLSKVAWSGSMQAAQVLCASFPSSENAVLVSDKSESASAVLKVACSVVDQHGRCDEDLCVGGRVRLAAVAPLVRTTRDRDDARCMHMHIWCS
jgi:hypothetical protein